MSQSRFSIVLVGVSALLRRPLVSRLRPADGERSSWVVFAARVGRFDSGFRWAGWPSGSLLPLFGMRRFGLPSAGWPSGSLLPFFGTHRFGVAVRRVGLRAHRFRFSARTASELPSAGWPRAHCFRFSACPASEIALGGLVLPLGGLAFGLTASAFRYAPLRSGRWASWPSGSRLPLFGMRCFGVAAGRVGSSAFRFGVAVRRVGLRAHCFRFSARIDSEWLLGEFVLPPSASEIPLGGLAFGLTTSAFRHAPLRSCRWASSFFRLPLRRFRSAGWFFRSVVGLRAHCFRFSARADPHRRTAEARTDGAQRHDNCFTSKHLSQHVNLPHRTP